MAAITRSDWNGAFNDRPELMAALQAHSRVVYSEVETDQEVVAASRRCRPMRISGGLIGGHGQPYMTELGSTGLPNGALDFGDESLMAQMRDDFVPGAPIVLLSCSTGHNGSDQANMANLLSAALPAQNVFAPREPANLQNFDFDDAGHLRGATFYSDHYQATAWRNRTRLGRLVSASAAPVEINAAWCDLMQRRSQHLSIELPGGRSLNAAFFAQLHATPTVDRLAELLHEALGLQTRDISQETALGFAAALTALTEQGRNARHLRMSVSTWQNLLSGQLPPRVFATVSNAAARPLPAVGVIQLLPE